MSVLVYYAALVVLAVSGSAGATNVEPQPAIATGYEVWASDQSNSAPDQAALGVRGGYLWIYDAADVEAQVEGGDAAQPLPCSKKDTVGPCDMLDVFPQDLQEYNGEDEPTGQTLGDLPGFGRLHGVLKDPQELYVSANMFTPGGGYVGIIDVQTKQAVSLFRVTEVGFGEASNRGVHMSFWSADGSALLVANLQGKAIERINVERDENGKITSSKFDRSATIGLGKGMSVVSEATYFLGKSQDGEDLIGGLTGSYKQADFSDTTPSGFCKENGCSKGKDGGRANNVPICPIVSENGLVYITLGGGGLLIADATSSPMAIVGEYSNSVVYGAGCGGLQVGDQVFLNAGVSASGAGADQSMFSVWSFDDTAYAKQQPANTPLPKVVFEDDGNTATGGNVKGEPSNPSGQVPGVTTRRDSHGEAATIDGKYIHVVDRIQNVMEVFNTKTYKRSTYDLTTKNGRGSKRPGACAAVSVNDDKDLPSNDPAPDLLEVTPDGKYMMIALRGPAPVSVSHGAQGSCPGVGVVQLSKSGKRGKLVQVLRTTNQVPDSLSVTPAGGVEYNGTERSDVHGTIVVSKANWGNSDPEEKTKKNNKKNNKKASKKNKKTSASKKAL